MRLSSDLGALMLLSEQAAAERDNTAPSKDFADACLRVEGRMFRYCVISISRPEVLLLKSMKCVSNHGLVCSLAQE